MPVVLPFNPGQMRFEGAQAGIGGVQQMLSALSNNAAPTLGNWQYNTDSTASGITLTVPYVLGGLLRRTGAGGGVTDTLPDAALLTAAIPGCYIGMTWPLLLCNLQNGTITLAQSAGATTTLTGTTTVVTVAARMYLFKVTACPVSIIGLSYLNNVVTLTTNLPHGLAASGSAVVASLANNAFNGTFTVATVPDAYHLTYTLASATAFATDSRTPNPQAEQPGLLNTASAVLCTGCFAWPATMIA